MIERTGTREIPEKYLDEFIDKALAEDIGSGDITSEILIPPGLQGQAYLLVKARGVLAGVGVAKRIFLRVDPSLCIEVLISDGSKVKPGDKAAVISGSVASILKAERSALNILQRLSGIASDTAKYVARLHGLSTKVADTRKTTPGLRILEKYAVRMGGGYNHRMGLDDGVLIKDNHLAAQLASGKSLTNIVFEAKKRAPPGLPVEVEVTSVEGALDAAKGCPDIIMLDNMTAREMSRAVELMPAGIKTEASGGVTLANIRSIAETGVDVISVGALTHSPKALDISLELEPRIVKLL